MNEQTRFLQIFRKFTMCRHKFSCFEHVIRTLYKTIGFYLILRVTVKLVGGDAPFNVFATQMKHIWPTVTDKVIVDTARIIEVQMLAGINLFLLRRCFYSFILESLAD
jgi:hypothetical protein